MNIFFLFLALIAVLFAQKSIHLQGVKNKNLIQHNSPQYTVDRRIVNAPIRNYAEYYLQNYSGNDVSGWADIGIDIYQDIVTGLIEIPKQFTSKFQVKKTAPNHPIIQDTRNNIYKNVTQLRHYAIPLPLINYGIIPMTWEQTFYPDENGYYGDNDPLDLVDISQRKRQMFDINRYKILGSFCLIDQGQLDWKVIAIDPVQSLVRNINSIEDVPKGRIDEILNWFRIYKTYQGKPQNTIGFGSKIFSKDQTMRLIEQTHEEFMKLKEGVDAKYQQKKQEFFLK